jgi:hypothetical protein
MGPNGRWIKTVATALACFVFFWVGAWLTAGRKLDTDGRIGVAAELAGIVQLYMAAWSGQGEKPEAVKANSFKGSAEGPAGTLGQMGRVRTVWGRGRLAVGTQRAAFISGLVAIPTTVIVLISQNGIVPPAVAPPPSTLGLPSSTVAIVAGLAVIFFALRTLKTDTRQPHWKIVSLIGEIVSLIFMFFSGFTFDHYQTTILNFGPSHIGWIGWYGLGIDAIFGVLVAVGAVILLIIVLTRIFRNGVMVSQN